MITVNIHVLLRVYILVSYNLHQLFVYQVDVINRLYTCILINLLYLTILMMTSIL